MKQSFYWIIGLLIIAVVGWWTFFNPNQTPDGSVIYREVLVYFTQDDPTQVVTTGVTREIKNSDNEGILLQRTISELLAGPTEAESALGLYTSINSGTELNHVKLNQGIATIDFNEQFDFQLGGSALVTAIREQVEKTAMQFSFVDQVLLTVNNGARAAVLEP